MTWAPDDAYKEKPCKVVLQVLDLQVGSVATYLDLPPREGVYDMLTETATMDEESFGQALLTYEEQLHVLTSPPEILPLDLISSDDVKRILDIARNQFDYVIVDMPSTLVQWTETVLTNAHVYFALLELDMRCAQNTLRFKRALQSEELPVETLRFVLNRAPKFTDLTSKSRVKRMADRLCISIDLPLLHI